MHRMYKFKHKCRKIGKGTEDDPIRPDLSSIPAIAELHKILDLLRHKHKEITNITFYIAQVKSETDTEFEVEIIVTDNLPNNIPEEVRKAWLKLKQLAETSGT